MFRKATAGEDLNNDQTAAATGARLWEDVAVGSVDVLGAGGFGLQSWDVEQLPRSREVVLPLDFGEETVLATECSRNSAVWSMRCAVEVQRGMAE